MISVGNHREGQLRRVGDNERGVSRETATAESAPTPQPEPERALAREPADQFAPQREQARGLADALATLKNPEADLGKIRGEPKLSPNRAGQASWKRASLTSPRQEPSPRF